MDQSPNLQLSYLMAAQSQKHVTYNEAMRALDALVQPSVLDKDLAAPPSTPDDGDRYIVAASATGAWTGQAGNLAAWQDGAWAFYTPREGWVVWVADEDVLYVYDGTAWDELSTSGGGGSDALAALGALTPAADRLPYFTGASTAALAPFSAFGRSLVDDADAPAARATLGLGTAAVQNTGTSGANVPLLNAANTWSAAQAISYNAGGAAQLTIADGTRGLTTTFAYNSAAGNGELKVAASNGGYNVMSFQQLGATGFSALAFYTHDVGGGLTIGKERAAFGYGNTSCPSPFTGKAYFESSCLTDGAIDGFTNLILVTTGAVANFGGNGNFVRQEFDGNGDTLFYAGPAGTTTNLILRHELGATLNGQLWINPANNLTDALKIGGYQLTGSTAGNVGSLSAVFNTSGVVHGLNIAITNTAAGAGSTALRVTGAPVYFDRGGSNDGPRALGLTVTALPSADFTPGSDPGDAKRQFALITPTTASRPVVFVMRNSAASKEFLDLVLDPSGTNSKLFYQWASGTYGGFIPLQLLGPGIGVGGNVATLTSMLTIAAGTTAKSQINLASSTAPSSPVNGDLWFDGSDLKLRAGGTTYTVTKT